MFINLILNNMAAGVKTDMDRTVVMATLEAMEELLKAVRGGWFEMERKVMEGLMVSIEDVLTNKVTEERKKKGEKNKAHCFVFDHTHTCSCRQNVRE